MKNVFHVIILLIIIVFGSCSDNSDSINEIIIPPHDTISNNDDSLVTLYSHLTRNGVLVSIGVTVKQDDLYIVSDIYSQNN